MGELPDELRPAYTLTVAEHRAMLREELAALLGERQTEPQTDAEHLTPAEVAERWRCTRRHVYSLIARGRIRVIRVGDPERGRMLIPASELARLDREAGRG